jgi:Cu-Zn family superoxide dismutase
MNFKRVSLMTALLAFALTGCAIHEDRHGAGKDHPVEMMAGRMAVATLTPTQGNNVRGLVMFHEVGGHLMVHAQISGLKPSVEQGFHVHEVGSCASTDGTSAGGHFNPGGQPHGPQTGAHHAGDLPALKADANGNVNQKFKVEGPRVTEGPTSVVGRSVIVHAQADDYTTQPTGNSGARVACGVIAAH